MKIWNLELKKTQKPKGTAEAYWHEVIKAQRLSGLSQQRYCTREGISYNSFKNRVCLLKESSSEGKDSGKFVEAVVREDPIAFKQDMDKPTEASSSQISNSLEIRCGGVWAIVVPPGFDEATLGRLMAMIKLHV